MTDVKQLVETMRTNEDIARKLFDIETQILTCKNSTQLFETLIQLLQEKFNLSGVYVLLNASTSIDWLTDDTSLKVNSFFSQHDQVYAVPQQQFEQYLDNQQIKLTNQLTEMSGVLPSHILAEYNSIANIPLMVEGKLFASLIFADVDAQRFHQHLGTYHLEQLAVKISLCFSNVIAREKLEYLATHDPLTGIKNRRSMEQTIRAEISRFERYHTPFSLIFIDCNKFKPINDTYGHDCGDAVLQFVAQSLSELVRASDDVFRFAGDEFVVTLSNQTIAEAQQAAERFKTFFTGSSIHYNGHEISPRISCGIAQCGLDEHVETILKRADEALYQQKRIS